jgi:NADPH2:quinone reductase
MFKGVKIDTYLIYIVEKDIRKEIINGLNKAIDEGSLYHRVAQTYSLEEVIKAHQDVESGTMVGNAVINL